MNTTRQDAWTKEEDVLLAETVLHYIREGKTQLEAFKKVGKKVTRTPAACGFRWNASIRKQYAEAIQLAKDERKNGPVEWDQAYLPTQKPSEHDHIDTAILLLKEMKYEKAMNEHHVQEDGSTNDQLKKENDQLAQQLQRYEEAWNEIQKLWEWVRYTDQ